MAHSKIPMAFGHPKGLFYLFFAELWERFSFYGMKALLIIYMTKQLLYTDEISFSIFAAYGSLVYATPPIGGMIADRILGYRKAIIWGGILMAAGHLIMAIEHEVFFTLRWHLSLLAMASSSPIFPRLSLHYTKAKNKKKMLASPFST